MSDCCDARRRMPGRRSSSLTLMYVRLSVSDPLRPSDSFAWCSGHSSASDSLTLAGRVGASGSSGSGMLCAGCSTLLRDVRRVIMYSTLPRLYSSAAVLTTLWSGSRCVQGPRVRVLSLQSVTAVRSIAICRLLTGHNRQYVAATC